MLTAASLGKLVGFQIGKKTEKNAPAIPNLWCYRFSSTLTSNCVPSIGFPSVTRDRRNPTLPRAVRSYMKLILTVALALNRVRFACLPWVGQSEGGGVGSVVKKTQFKIQHPADGASFPSCNGQKQNASTINEPGSQIRATPSLVLPLCQLAMARGEEEQEQEVEREKKCKKHNDRHSGPARRHWFI